MKSTISYTEIVATLAKPGDQIVAELTASDAHIMHMAMGISGESGEVLDAIKKAIIYRKQLDKDNVIEELGDLEFYMEGLRQGLGISREEVLNHNIEKLGKRYAGFQYTDTAAKARADKEK